MEKRRSTIPCILLSGLIECEGNTRLCDLAYSEEVIGLRIYKHNHEVMKTLRIPYASVKRMTFERLPQVGTTGGDASSFWLGGVMGQAANNKLKDLTRRSPLLIHLHFHQGEEMIQLQLRISNAKKECYDRLSEMKEYLSKATEGIEGS